jgi:hypothetical protein
MGMGGIIPISIVEIRDLIIRPTSIENKNPGWVSIGAQ